MDESMIDRVAQAFYESMGFDDGWEEATDIRRDLSREKARAAIEAMREPTTEMHKVGIVPIQDAVQSAYDRGRLGHKLGLGLWWKAHLREAWQAMIDKVLEDGRTR